MTEDGQHGVLTEFVIKIVVTEHKPVHVRVLLPYHCTVVKTVLVKQPVQGDVSKLNVQVCCGFKFILSPDLFIHIILLVPYWTKNEKSKGGGNFYLDIGDVKSDKKYFGVQNFIVAKLRMRSATARSIDLTALYRVPFYREHIKRVMFRY